VPNRWIARARPGRSDRRGPKVGLLTLVPFTLFLSPSPGGVPLTPERLDSLTQGRTMTLRMRTTPLSQVAPGITQQMLYRTRLAPETPDLTLSVFCADTRLSRFEHAMVSLFGYKLVGRSQGEGMGLVFVTDPQAKAAAERQRLQGRTAAEAGIARALAWMKQPAELAEVSRTRCPAAGSLRDENVRRAFGLHATLTKAQRGVVLAGHPVSVPYAALPAAARSLLPTGKPAPRSLTFYLYTNPWSEDSHPRLAVRAEPSGTTWLSCPPLELAPARGAAPPESESAFKKKLTGQPDLEELEPGEEAPAFLEWLADEGHLSILAEPLHPPAGGVEALKKFAATCQGLTLEQSLDRIASFFGATWRYDDGWVLLQRRSSEGA
jgi:hypothetical protein